MFFRGLDKVCELAYCTSGVITTVSPNDCSYNDKQAQMRLNTYLLFSCFKHCDAYCCHMGTAIKHPVPDRV